MKAETTHATTNPTPMDELKTHTQGAFMTLNLITQAAHSILDTKFTAPNPKPDWFDGLNAKLDDVKVLAQQWVDDIAPDVTGGVPVQVIDYGTTYSAFTAEINSIANKHPDAQGQDNPYVMQIHKLVVAMDNEVEKIIAHAEATQATLKDWGAKMQKAHDALSDGTSNIQKAEASLQADINKMNNAIKVLNATIAEENKAIAYSAIGIGVGIFLTIAGIALAPETGGSSLVVAGTGALLVVGGAVTWGIMQHKINGQFDEIAKDQSRLNDDERQIVALKGLDASSSMVLSNISTSEDALSAFRTSWAVFQGELQGVARKLEAAEGALSTIVQQAFTNAAADEWKGATDFAQNLANAPVHVVQKDLPMSGEVQGGADFQNALVQLRPRA